MTDRMILTLHLPVSVSTFGALMNALGEEYPDAYLTTEGEAYVVWTGTTQADPTDWVAFAGDLLSNDPERLRKHMPPWLQQIVDGAAAEGPEPEYNPATDPEMKRRANDG